VLTAVGDINPEALAWFDRIDSVTTKVTDCRVLLASFVGPEETRGRRSNNAGGACQQRGVGPGKPEFVRVPLSRACTPPGGDTHGPFHTRAAVSSVELLSGGVLLEHPQIHWRARGPFGNDSSGAGQKRGTDAGASTIVGDAISPTACRAHVTHRFNPANLAAGYEKAYRHAISSHTRPTPTLPRTTAGTSRRRRRTGPLHTTAPIRPTSAAS
jgi:hypothetical protein